jgi:hypothetical protein
VYSCAAREKLCPLFTVPCPLQRAALNKKAAFVSQRGGFPFNFGYFPNFALKEKSSELYESQTITLWKIKHISTHNAAARRLAESRRNEGFEEHHSLPAICADLIAVASAAHSTADKTISAVNSTIFSA